MENETQSDIKSYDADWLIYAMGFSYNTAHGFRIALGSFIEDLQNKVEILAISDEAGGSLEKRAEFVHNYPPTKIMWIPDREGTCPDLLISSGDHLRIWTISEQNEVTLKSKLSNKRSNEYGAPLTSFDWNINSLNKVGTSSIDTTCTIWDIEHEKISTQLIAHDKEVYDIAFSADVNCFASVGADGSVRQFDERNLEHSTILYESQDFTPLLRLAWNKQDGKYLATMAMDSKTVYIIDIRSPGVPVAELNGHNNTVNAIAWAPCSSTHICTAGDDCSTLIWDLANSSNCLEDPILQYNAGAEVNMLQWSDLFTSWLGISFNQKLQLLRV